MYRIYCDVGLGVSHLLCWLYRSYPYHEAAMRHACYLGLRYTCRLGLRNVGIHLRTKGRLSTACFSPCQQQGEVVTRVGDRGQLTVTTCCSGQPVVVCLLRQHLFPDRYLYARTQDKPPVDGLLRVCSNGPK